MPCSCIVAMLGVPAPRTEPVTISTRYRHCGSSWLAAPALMGLAMRRTAEPRPGSSRSVCAKSCRERWQ